MKGHWKAGLALVALAWAGQALAQSDVIALGSALPVTGKDAATGRYYKDAYTFAVAEINAKGGVEVGGKRYKLKLEIRDNQSVAALDARLYDQLLSGGKVDFVLGSYSSDTVLADSAIAERYETPMVEGGGAAGQIFSRGFKYVFGTLPRAEDYFGSTIAMLGQLRPKARTVALLASDDAFDLSVAAGTRAILKQAGLQLVLDRQYPAKTSDFTSLLGLVKAQSPDVILWGGLAPDVIEGIREMKRLGVSAKDLASFTVGPPTPEFRAALGKDADYAFGMTPWLPTATLKDAWFGNAARFEKAFAAQYGYPPDYHAAAAVAAVEVFARAIAKAGSLDKKAVREAIARSDFGSLYGRVKFAANGQIEMPQVVIEIEGGKIVPVFTDRLIGKPLYPVPPWRKR